MNSAFVGYEKFCSSYPNQRHSIVANHFTVADIRGQPFHFWEGGGGGGVWVIYFFPQTSDHIIFFSLTYMYKVIKCQICPWKLFFPMKSVCIYILFPKSPHWKANGWPPSDSLFGHWGTWLYYVFLHHTNINGLDICFNSRFLNTSWRKVLNLVFNPYFISIKWGVKNIN